jgi:hypothetical protein
MGTQFEVQPKIAHVAASLIAAWESGDRLQLEAAIRSAESELSAEGHASPFTNEIRELLLCIVQQLSGLLSAAPAADLRRGGQWEVCYGLLHHAQGAAVAAGQSGLPMQTGARG